MIQAYGLTQTMNRLKRIQNALPGAVEAGLDVKLYEPEFRRIATQIIYVNVEHSQETFIFQAMRTFQTLQRKDGFQVSLWPRPGTDSPAILSPDAPAEEVASAVRSISDDIIMEWVMTYKQLTPERDFYADGTQMSPETIATRVRSAILADAEAWTGVTDSGSINPTSLAAFAGLYGLTVAEGHITAVLKMILDAWCLYARKAVAANIRANIRKLL